MSFHQKNNLNKPEKIEIIFCVLKTYFSSYIYNFLENVKSKVQLMNMKFKLKLVK